MKLVIFVGTDQSLRASMAAAFFDAFTMPSIRALPVAPRPKGTPPEVLEAMSEVRMRISSEPQLATRSALERAALIVRFGDIEVPHGVPSERWDVPLPGGLAPERVREVRDVLRRRVWRLVAQRGWYRLQPVQAFLSRRDRAKTRVEETQGVATVATP